MQVRLVEKGLTQPKPYVSHKRFQLERPDFPFCSAAGRKRLFEAFDNLRLGRAQALDGCIERLDRLLSRPRIVGL